MSLELGKDQLFGVTCKAKKVKLEDENLSYEYSAPRNEAYLMLNMGICKKDQDITKEESIHVLREMGFVRFDDLVPILGEKRVLEIVSQLDADS